MNRPFLLTLLALLWNLGSVRSLGAQDLVITNVVVEACGGVVTSPRALVVRSGVGVFSGHVGSLRGG